jgi:hypothetical protein
MLDSSICHVYLQDMKRSEALKLIDETYDKFVQDWLNADINNLEGFDPLNKRVLKVLEQAGMLPPTIRLPAFGVMDNAWEPEDE